MNCLTRQAVAAEVGARGVADSLRAKVDGALVRYDAWYVVLLAVIMVLAVVIATGLAIWCVVYKGKSFTGSWNWNWTGVSVNVQCV